MPISPFDYPARALDGLLSRAGGIERAARAAWRYLRAGKLEELRRALAQNRRSTTSAEETSPRTEPPAAAPPPGAPILYLPAVAWSYRFQRPQHLALALARAGHPVLYVDGFLRSRLYPERELIRIGLDLYHLRMRVPGRPDPYRQPLNSAQAAHLARVIVAGLGAEKPAMVFVQLPFWAELGRELATRLETPLVYDRIDLHGGFPGVPHEIETVEERLFRNADLVCATAGLLAERPREVNPRVLLLPNGVDLETFSALDIQKRWPREPGRPIRAGYVGALGPWFDVAALREAARALPDWTFLLAGRVEDPEVAALAELPNLETLGEIPFRAVPAFLAGLDVALVPFRDLPLTRAVDPVKLYEALAAGLPVVARRLPEMERWSAPLVYLYTSPRELVTALLKAVESDGEEASSLRRAAARRECWDRRAAALLETLAVLPAAGRIRRAELDPE